MPRGGGREESDSGYDYRKRKLGVREEEMSSGSFGDASIDDFVVDDYDAAQEEVEGPDGTSSSGAPSGPMWGGGGRKAGERRRVPIEGRCDGFRRNGPGGALRRPS